MTNGPKEQTVDWSKVGCINTTFNYGEAPHFEKVSFWEWQRADMDSSVDNKLGNYDRISIPKRATVGSAGYDFTIPYDLEVKAGEEYLIPTGIKCIIPQYMVLLICPRSGLGTKYGMRLCNTIGVIDSDYYGNESNEGHIFVKMKADKSFKLSAGDRFCQGIFTLFFKTYNEMYESDVLKTKRVGGFSSTDENNN